jgi:chorismate synthase
MTDDFVLRDLASEEDYEACVALQRETWGDHFRELVGPALLKVSQKIGGIAAGAFDRQDALAAFVFGMTGLKDGELIHWSHMLAARVASRDRGLGQRLKLYQRERARVLGVGRMLWTYDPLVARNAHLNLNVLGTRIERYVADMYGTTLQSRTDEVIGTDRCIVVWTLDRQLAVGAAPTWPDAPVVTLATEAPALPTERIVLVEIPKDVHHLKDTDADGARAWRRLTRRALTHYLDRGYRVTGLAHRPEDERTAYILQASTGV